MNQLFDLGQLPWVKGELIDALSQARRSLEAHVREPEAEAALDSLVNNLHQVSGTLRMVQVHGAALLAEEMESLAHAMRDGTTNEHDEAREALMCAMLQLPDYLDRLTAGHRDLPTVLLPIVNDLRSVRGADPLTEIALFAPDLARELPADLGNRTAVGNLQQEAKVLRTRFQRALLAWFRGADAKASLNTLAAILERLQALCQSHSARRLWWVAAGAVDAVAAGAVEDSVAVHRVIGKLDRHMKDLSEVGESLLIEQSSADLLTQLLYVVARAREVAGRVSDIKACYQLDELLPGAAEQAQAQESLAGQNAELFASVGKAVKEEIGGLKDRLDQIVRSGAEPGERVEALKASLTALGDTLSMLGLEDARDALLAQADQVAESAAAGTSIEVSSLMDLASTLLFVEASVERLAAGMNDSVDAAEPHVRMAQSEYSKVTVAVIKEAIENLDRAKDAISSYSQTENGASFLNDAPQWFAQVKGALSLLGESRAAALTQSVGRYVHEQLIVAHRRLSSQELESLADCVCGLEYFLESLRDQGLYGKSAMEVAEASISDLGYGVEEADTTDSAGTNRSPLEEGLALIDIIDQASEGGAAWSSKDVEQEQDSIDRDVRYADQPADAQADPEVDRLSATPEELQKDRGIEPSPTRPTEPIASTQAEDSGQNTALDLPVAGEDVEQEIVEIFLEEAEEEIENIREQLPAWNRMPDDAESLATIRRSFHTLKGSGRLVGARRISELAWAYENMLNRVIDGAIRVDETMLDSLSAAVNVLPDLVQEIKVGHAGAHPVAQLIQRAEAILGGTPVPEKAGTRQASPEDSVSAPTAPEADGSQSEPPDQSEQIVPDTEGGHGMSAAEPDQTPADARVASPAGAYIEVVESLLADLDTNSLHMDGAAVSRLDALCSGFSPEHDSSLRELCAQLVSYAESLVSSHQPLPADVCKALHDSLAVMKGVVSDGAGEETAQQLIFQALEWVQKWRQAERLADSQRTDDTENFGDRGSLDDFADPGDDHQMLRPAEGAVAPGAPPDVSAQTNSAVAVEPPVDTHHSAEPEPDITPEGSEQATVVESDAYVQHDEQLLEIFLEESEKNLETGEEALQRWRHHPDDEEALAELQRTLHTLKGGARMADLAPIGDLAHAVESLVIAIAEKRPDRSAEAFEAVQAAHDRLGSMLEDVSGRRPLTCEADLIARLRAFHATPEVADVPRDGQPSDSEPTRAGTTVPVTDSEDEIVAVFVEEAALILENIDSTLHAWKEEPHELAVMEPLQRYLHTLKGGARMAGFSAMGDLAHSVESLAEQISSGVVEINDPTVSLMREACDSLAAMFDRVERRQQITAVPGLVERLEALSEGDTGTNTPVGDLSENTVPAESGEYEHGVVRRGEERRATSRTSHELVRVSADLLDNMVNFAGEVSIYRSRLEQQIGAYRFNLVEMEQTVSRLRDQLRKLEIETEAQILFRYEKEGLSGHAEFDPLELDRYSHMQELSRSLLESVGDLASIQNLLESVTRESETLLLQQSRVNTELQEGLMRTRMVPFLGLAPRMRRIVRQLCHELGKKAELELSGADGEMDRTVVDRLIAPIEHMLRNAVSHGIEAPELRRQNGKPEAGMIRIRLEREGTDIVLNIADDGAGIDLSAIRRKAVERGLMQPETDLPDAEVLQFILETGFSTADRVTQVAGRGVGMDVVNSEVKQLGGVLRIESEPGQGTSFTIRLPFTLALNQALLIEVGEDTYAVPLSTIEGVVRMDAARIKSFYADPEARFEYGGMAYEVRHLGTTLGGAQARLESDSVTLPVLLARTGERCVGFQVEKLLGNREIVVKSVGPQISTVTGITGATILGDGRVVMILDVASLLRGTIPPVAPRVLETAPSADRGGPVTVMIVDDSITVRKVTTRLLERNEMQVIAAKDGLDAVALLQDHVPDIILLDIEMPRMDGFEVATHVRNEDRLRGIPIIMITSRTGDKHRQRAMQVGVNRYLGKPFQENDLVGTIRELLNESGSTEVASDA